MNERNKKENRPSFRKKPEQTPTGRQAGEKKFYDNADMMQLFNVTSRTLQRWRDDKLVPFKKLGGKIYYLAHKVDDLMEAEDENAD
ncbi:helix-turn-helix domain-containing protein [Kaistella flava (ex Peng et al. 2021)]|uniref:Helix-turn-helix domain-containing protein n=1 Tax=Kaistella flava (ex Peng et al. 2021) TaxID=2038776 RepID=A0A7M2Y4Z5_9FLAO|nr:helix-turn-helix domain-containing protein [Kaistella flava (ex Peng et al. 2021)]QOW09190.1 helix-turn-helix domain-containing protein [Kaistella flava (ex Peng et al. 2021)]